MKCVFCGSEIIKDTQTLERRIKDHLVYIKNVPIDLCKSCGEVYIDDDVVSEMNNILSVLKNRELLETTVIDFDSFREQSATLRIDVPLTTAYNNLVTT